MDDVKEYLKTLSTKELLLLKKKYQRKRELRELLKRKAMKTRLLNPDTKPANALPI